MEREQTERVPWQDSAALDLSGADEAIACREVSPMRQARRGPDSMCSVSRSSPRQPRGPAKGKSPAGFSRAVARQPKEEIGGWEELRFSSSTDMEEPMATLRRMPVIDGRCPLCGETISRPRGWFTEAWKRLPYPTTDSKPVIDVSVDKGGEEPGCADQGEDE